MKRAGFSLLWQLAWLFPVVAMADVSTGMRTLFNNIGAYGSVDGPGYIAAQTRHVFTGGGLTYRAPSQRYQLFSATPPSLQAGCGGIDLYSGSFSFINKDQFIQMLNNIAANSVGLAFKTALCSTSANLCQAIEDLQRTIQGLNRFNIDSCEAAKSLVGGFMGSAQQSAQSACQSSGWLSGIAGDANEAREMCAQDSGFAMMQTAAAESGAAETQPVEFVGGNLTWEVLKEAAGAFDRQEREFLQSMLGTHVVTTVSLSLRYHPPTISSISQLNEREIIMLACDEPTKCLHVSAVTVSLGVSFLDLAQERLADIRSRIEAGSDLTDSQVEFVAGSPVPVLALAQADAAGAEGLIEIAGEAVAYTVAQHYLTRSLREAASTAASWKSRSVNEAELVRTMVDDSRKLRTELAQEAHRALDRVGSLLELNERLRGMSNSMSSQTLEPLSEP